MKGDNHEAYLKSSIEVDNGIINFVDWFIPLYLFFYIASIHFKGFVMSLCSLQCTCTTIHNV